MGFGALSLLGFFLFCFLVVGLCSCIRPVCLVVHFFGAFFH